MAHDTEFGAWEKERLKVARREQAAANRIRERQEEAALRERERQERGPSPLELFIRQLFN